MTKLQILMLQLLGCIVFGIIIGTVCWWFDEGKTREKASDCPGEHPNAQMEAGKFGVGHYNGAWRNYDAASTVLEGKTVLICHPPISPCPGLFSRGKK